MKRVRLREQVNVLSKGQHFVLRLNDEMVVITPNNDALHHCVKHWIAGGSEDHFRQVTEEQHPTSWDTFKPHFDRLLELGFFEDMDVEHELTAEEVGRWTRMMDYLSRYETEETNRYEYMRRIRHSKVLVVGVGGMGSWMTTQLLGLGIGHIVLLDGDHVEVSNLNRTAMYKPADAGKLKVDCAVAYAKEFSPHTKVEAIPQFVTGPEDLLPHLDGVDLVLGCADKPVFLITKWISEACTQAKVPYLFTIGGQVGPLAVPDSDQACPLCEFTFRTDKYPNLMDTILNQGDFLFERTVGSVVSFPAIVSGVAGFEVMRFLSGYEKPVTVNACWKFDTNMEFRVEPLTKHPSCINCATK
ncbi:HesA/MoeB/ThiF family protein [Tumebacillus algifaecis]|uniref:HesA/MoeB/ThiF family protein n=1 Tax=Tumebacillus algifaecis TaxID=1214604 RepID=UPI0012FDA130|nr:ThiF family adenylyltransferase [Tumebacillus algifaecis]